jgi:CRP-like cAMP-binding protein
MEETALRPRLDRLAFTSGLTPAQLDKLAEIATPVRWDADTIIFQEGGLDAQLYAVETGRVAIEVTLPGRGTVTLMTAGPGEVFGWSSLFYRRPKTAAARAVEPTDALALDAARLRALCDADPSLGYTLTQRILNVVSDRLKATRIQLLDLFRQD